MSCLEQNEFHIVWAIVFNSSVAVLQVVSHSVIVEVQLSHSLVVVVQMVSHSVVAAQAVTHSVVFVVAIEVVSHLAVCGIITSAHALTD